MLFSSGVLIALSGNRPAQRFLIAILGATVLSAASDILLPKAITAHAYLAIDAMLLAIALYFVLRTTSYWPIWFAGFHSIAVASEIARLAYSGPMPGIYLDLAGFWSVPALLSMVMGINMDRHYQQAQFRKRNAAGATG